LFEYGHGVRPWQSGERQEARGTKQEGWQRGQMASDTNLAKREEQQTKTIITENKQMIFGALLRAGKVQCKSCIVLLCWTR